MSRKTSVILKCVSRVKYGWGSSSYEVKRQWCEEEAWHAVMNTDIVALPYVCMDLENSSHSVLLDIKQNQSAVTLLCPRNPESFPKQQPVLWLKGGPSMSGFTPL